MIFSYTPVEDPSVYENVFADFLAHLTKVTGKKIKWFGAESYAAQVEALRSGRLHIAGVASGPTPFAVNLAGFRPIVAMEKHDNSIGYTLQPVSYTHLDVYKRQDIGVSPYARLSPARRRGAYWGSMASARALQASAARDFLPSRYSTCSSPRQ